MPATGSSPTPSDQNSVSPVSPTGKISPVDEDMVNREKSRAVQSLWEFVGKKKLMLCLLFALFVVSLHDLSNSFSFTYESHGLTTHKISDDSEDSSNMDLESYRTKKKKDKKRDRYAADEGGEGMYDLRQPDSWWVPLIDRTATTFKPKPAWWDPAADGGGRCHPTLHGYAEGKGAPLRGLIYAKQHKASSSTLQGINHVIAHHVGRRYFQLNSNTTHEHHAVCEHYDNHRAMNNAHRRDPKQSLLWSFVRFPLTRDLSQVYHFGVTRNAIDPNGKRAFEMFKGAKNRQFRFLLKLYPHKHIKDFASRSATAFDLADNLRTMILESFDFIGVTERMSESLAVMTLLWDLDPTDVIVLSAKENREGLYDDLCYSMVPPPRKDSELPLRIFNYVHSPKYTSGNVDFLLYDAINRSLDLTIKSIGVERVRERAALIESLQSFAEQACRDEAVFPCSSEGRLQKELSFKNCYRGDSGCAHQCIDRVLKDQH